MQYRALGNTDIKVSAICLGTMTWGDRNTEADAHAQLDLAVGAGVNFIDTAEMYPSPIRAETQGRTESCLGSWLKKSGQRDKLIVATKVSGPSERVKHLRDGRGYRTRRDIEAALDASLKRLQTDYVDLYQTHWPDRDANFFGRLNYHHAPERDGTPIAETLAVMADLVEAGKVRHVGVSNETPWGVSQWLRAADDAGLARIVSIQNPLNLLNRSAEIGLSEFCHREQVGLLAYSPLAFGVLSGKYLDGAKPEGARLTLHGDQFKRYVTDNGRAATARYAALAREHGLDPAQMALAFVVSRPYVTSAIIGATDLEQLRADLDSATLVPGQDLLREIDNIHTEFPNPCP